MGKEYLSNPTILPGTILPQASPNYHLNALADNIDAGKQIIKDRQKKIDEANKLAEEYDFNEEDILGQWIPDLQKENEAMLNREIDYRKKGVDWHDPRNMDQYNERKLGYNKIDSDLSTARAMTKTYYDAQKLLTNGSTSKAFDLPKSYARLGEFAKAKNYKEAQAVYDKYGGELLVNNTAKDLSKWNDYFDDIVKSIPAGNRFIDNKGATEEANARIDELGRVFDDPAVKKQYLQDGGTEEEWSTLVGLYKPQLESRKFSYKPKVFAPTGNGGGDKPDAEYLTTTDELIRGIQSGDNAFAGALVGAAVDDDKIEGVQYRMNDKGQKNLVLTLTGKGKKKVPIMEVDKKGNKVQKTNSAGTPQFEEKETTKEVWINLSDPSNYNKILNYLNTAPGRKKIGIEELDAMNKKNNPVTEAGLPVVSKKTTSSGLPIITPSK